MESYVEKVKEALDWIDYVMLERVIETIRATRQNGGTVWLFGNGGSAATAIHMANDLIKMGGVDARCLNAEIAYQTALANDEGYENIFKIPLDYYAKFDDCAIGISCSGNSENVYRGLAAVRGKLHLDTILMTQNDGGKCANKAHYVLSAVTNDIRIAEDVHMIMEHIIAGELRKQK